ncbi:MAG: glutamine synthetase family protein [Deinococcota bacterium]
MPPNLSFENLKKDVKNGFVDTVIAAIPDMQGRLMGKRFHAEFFVDQAWEETHCCQYLLATDFEMNSVEGYSSTSWAKGYGDYVMKPDLDTLKRLPWSPGTAFVLCDVIDHHSHEEVAIAPRSILKKQLARLGALGFSTAVATELEFFVFTESYADLHASNYQTPTPISAYNEDYHLFQTAKEESLMRNIRNHLHAAGIRVENTKGEAAAGQAEINVYYDDALITADNHCLIKQGIKEMALQDGKSVTFMAKWHSDTSGSSSHIHQSLQDLYGNSVFYDPAQPHSMSMTMQHYLAGLLHYSSDITLAMAPFVNSYKRFAAGTFAPTKAVWSLDNRTAGYRVVGTDSPGVRVETRIGGADLNPYIAMAANLAAGLAGIEQKLELPSASSGDAYMTANLPTIPTHLRAATDTFYNSAMLREAWGDEVVEHYSRAARWEQEHFDTRVTDYELRRGLEQS